MTSMDDLITAQEAAALLRMHVKRVQQLARDGKLPAVRYGRKWLFRRNELIEARGRGQRPANVELSSGIEISARNQLRGQVVEIRADWREVRIGQVSTVTMRSQPTPRAWALSSLPRSFPRPAMTPFFLRDFRSKTGDFPIAPRMAPPAS